MVMEAVRYVYLLLIFFLVQYCLLHFMCAISFFSVTLFHEIVFHFVQVANYCRDRMHLALAEEIEVVKEGLVHTSIKDNCQEQWNKAFTNCFLKVDAEVGGRIVLILLPRKQLVPLLLLPLFVRLIS